MVILGIDPGLAIVGYGVISCENGSFRPLAYGAITTPAHTPVQDRLLTIYEELSGIIARYRPDDIAVEELFFNTNATTGISVAEARGVILLCARQHHLNVFEYTPSQVKQSVVGYGKAEKNQVITMIKTLLHLKTAPRLDDTADALAIAICHGHTGASRLRQFYNLK